MRCTSNNFLQKLRLIGAPKKRQ